MSTGLGFAVGGHSLASPYWSDQRTGALLNTLRAGLRNCVTHFPMIADDRRLLDLLAESAEGLSLIHI